MVGIFIGLGAISIVVLVNFLMYLWSGKRGFNSFWNLILDVAAVVGMPLLYLSVLDFGMDNDCCDESATFSPEHRWSIYVLIGLAIAAYFYSVYKKNVGPPIVELLVHVLLLVGIALNIVLMFHLDIFIALFGNPSIILLFTLALLENHKKLLHATRNFKSENNFFLLWIWKLLHATWWVKYPVLLGLAFPFMLVLAVVLFLFGHQPDAFILAFTDTYKHGLSELDHLCENVTCGGHYLCSVAANGHPVVVQPTRLGVRGGRRIICNRQLLVSNAFEELIEERAPKFHKVIRRHYNKVGDLVHRYYAVFNNKLVSDVVFVIMKPAEWFFVVMLYLFDTKPENRIAQQYLNRQERKAIQDNLLGLPAVDRKAKAESPKH